MNEQDQSRRPDESGNTPSATASAGEEICGIETPRFDFGALGDNAPTEPAEPTEPTDTSASTSDDAPHPEESEMPDLNPYGDPNAPAPVLYQDESREEDPERRRNLSIASLVCSILSYFLGLTCCLGFPLAIASIVISLMERSRYGKMSGMSLTGLILSVVNLLVFIGIILLYVFLFVLAATLGATGA